MAISQKKGLLIENLCMKVALKVSVHPPFIVSPKWEEMLIRLYPQFA